VPAKFTLSHRCCFEEHAHDTDRTRSG
jgi:hypothetical protein